MKGAQGPTSIPLCLKQKENEIFVWLVHCQNPKCSIRPHRGSLASAVPNGCIAMEMCDTFVDELSVSRWTSSFPAPAFEKYEYRIKPVEEVKYMKNGAEEEQKIAARNQENLEKSASSNVRLKTNKEIPGLVHQPRANMHISESQQEFFRMLDEKIEKGRDYCSEEEDIT
uniref:Chromosome 1 open reading frame 21 n=1 Tax=Ailuropoda melanoleuca TaxID=9646 RepID=G1M4A7_AILME